MKDSDLGMRFKHIDESIARHANLQLKECGLTLSQSFVMGYLAHSENGRCTQPELERIGKVSHPTVVGLVQRLKAKGLVDTCYGPDDSRAKVVFLTDKGWHVCAAADEHRTQMDTRLTKGMTENEIAQLATMLDRILHNLED